MPFEEILRQKILQDIYAKLSDDEKQQLALYLMQERDHREVMDALQRQHTQVSRMAQRIERQSWLTDFGSDVAANFFTDGLIWLTHRLLRK